ncbi:DUF4160 domain-containing protein [Burkholderiaceae bacterium FT117]|uniref:DUF4160 domain-containing protein n=1 Tax=Zeimonas sediminis TaxID=2944268 RepID=UPI002342F782|nr:DUF4160 domain-containing protein [Zeimonas sediminis]MCM5572011.1 DUF4160 domain-containing protein [Zeimonas sediminis]
MTPTLLREGGFRFCFFSREELRPHVHVQHANGEAKFWLEPMVEVANNAGLSDRQLRAALLLVKDRSVEFRDAWDRHFGPG